MALRLDAEQRFTCQQCGRCCRRGWDIALIPSEVEAYRKARVERWFREREDAPEGSEREPFEPIPGHAPYVRIRKRADGACGFLSPGDRCRIHEELGGERKPLTCRLFPFRFHPADGPPVATASFCCPTVVANKGELLAAQAKELTRLQKDWASAYPEPEAPPELVAGRPLPKGALGTLRSILREMLDRPGADGAQDLQANVGRIACLVEDIGRHRVLSLAPDRFVEYLELTGRYLARTEKTAAPRPPSRLGRLLFRGFLYSIAAARVQTDDGRASGLRLGLRLRLALLLLHFHGLWPAIAGYDLRAAGRAHLVKRDPAVAGLIRNYLRATIETLGTGRRPLLEELCVALAFLNAAGSLAAMRAAQAGSAEIDATHFVAGLMDAVDLTHAAPGGPLHHMLGVLSGGVESIYLFAAGGPLAAQ